MNTVERIETLRKEIEQKKVKLGLDADVLTMKSLKKYSNISALSFPKSVDNDIYYYRDAKHRFKDIRYTDFKDISRLRHVTDKIVSEVKKKIYGDISEMVENLSIKEAVIAINNYITEHHKTQHMKIIELNNPSDNLLRLVSAIYTKYEKTQIKNIIGVVYHDNEEDLRYSSYDVLMKGRGVGSFSNSYAKANTTDFMNTLAENQVVSIVYDYLFKNPTNYELIISKLEERVVFDKKEVNSCLKNVFEEILKGETRNFDFVKTIMALTLEVMLQDSFDIQEYEVRLRNLSGSYAKTYMTKKNIPKKTQAFMDNNNFLAMFDYVEADEQCDLEKLEVLSNEFILLSNQLCLPKALNHSLRFRRLGKLKAAGVYYPGFNTLAVDVDSVSSFIHEFFHFIDFDNKILSLNNDFKPLLNLYRDLMDDALEQLDEQHPVKKLMDGKSKYGRAYYRSNEEAFARMGEIYVSEVLGIKTNFNRIDFDEEICKVVYPRTPEMLNLIKNYYTKLFMLLKDSKQIVQF